MVSEISLIASYLAALAGFVFYAWTRHRRRSRAAWYWMAFPLIYRTAVYVWIATANPPLEARIYPIRLGDFIEHVQLAFIVILLALLNLRDEP